MTRGALILTLLVSVAALGIFGCLGASVSKTVQVEPITPPTSEAPTSTTAARTVGQLQDVSATGEGTGDEPGHDGFGLASAPEVAPGFTPEQPDNPNAQKIDGCLVPTGAVEVFPEEAVARGQRVFDSPGERQFLRADGTCVNLLLEPDLPVPDYAPDHIDGPTGIYD